jgi:DNA-binding PadR family transcriptional regulator
VRKAVQKSLGNFWSESYGQIYPTLKSLAEEGLADRSVEHRAGKPDRHVYTITKKGLERLNAWLLQPAEAHKYRVEVLVKLLFGELLGPEACLDHVHRFRNEHQGLLSHYQAIKKELIADWRGAPGLPYWLLTVECGLKVGAAYVAWCDQTEKVLRELAGGAAHEKQAPTQSRSSGAGDRAARNRKASGRKP